VLFRSRPVASKNSRERIAEAQVDFAHRELGITDCPGDDLYAHLWLGRGKILYDLDRYAEAIPVFETVLSRHPAAGAAPEAAFLRGVSGYKSTHDPKELRKTYDLLTARYPQSEWARRSEPYSAIPL